MKRHLPQVPQVNNHNSAVHKTRIVILGFTAVAKIASKTIFHVVEELSNVQYELLCIDRCRVETVVVEMRAVIKPHLSAAVIITDKVFVVSSQRIAVEMAAVLKEIVVEISVVEGYVEGK